MPEQEAIQSVPPTPEEAPKAPRTLWIITVYDAHYGALTSTYAYNEAEALQQTLAWRGRYYYLENVEIRQFKQGFVLGRIPTSISGYEPPAQPEQAV